jgi:hypothetical protein
LNIILPKENQLAFKAFCLFWLNLFQKKKKQNSVAFFKRIFWLCFGNQRVGNEGREMHHWKKSDAIKVKKK